VQPKVLIECGACKSAMQSPLSSIEYDVLLATGLISRHCDRCKETTRWKPSEQPVTSEMITQSRQAEPLSTERRKSRRLNLVMRLRVRNNWGVVDIAETRNVSKGGLCFLTKNSSTWATKSTLRCPLPTIRHPSRLLPEWYGQDWPKMADITGPAT